MTRDDRRRGTARLAPRAIHGVTRGQHERLGIDGRIQVFRRAVGCELPQVLPQDLRSFSKSIAHGFAVGEALQHADRLRALSRKNQCEFHRCYISHESRAPGEAAADAFQQHFMARA